MEVITSHTNADFDTLASMVGAKKLYPEARLVFSGSLERGLKDAIDKKKIVLPFKFDKAREIDLDKVTRIILVDVRQAGRLGVFNGLVGRAGVDVHVYDHHPSTAEDVRASFEAIEPCGSTSTVISLILRDRKIALTRDEATILMAGIYEDTGFLSYPSTTLRDFEAASFLLSSGADLSKVSDLLRKELTPEDVSLLNEFLHSEARYTIGGVEVVIVEGYLERYAADISALAHRIRDIEGMDCLFMLVDSEDRVHMIARSRTAHVDVGKVARAVGGGGHAHAASATLKGVTLIEAKERLLEAIRQSVVPRKTAAEIMSFPPIAFPAALTLSSAMEQMRRYNINAAPVVGDGAGVIGIITRQVVDKAVYHGLGSSTVSDYMTTEYETVSHGSSIDEIRAKVMGRGVRLLPVLKDKLLVGVITRTDLIKILQEGLREAAEGIGAGRPRSLSRLIRERLPAWAAALLKEAGEVAESLGVNAYAVGGFVRDLLLRRENLDIDVVIEGGDGIAFANELAGRMGARVRAHRRFRTAVVILPDGYKLDVATARLEYYEKPGALPTVEVSSLKLDLYRRDFVINTLAVALNPRRFGELIDFFGAQRDIKEKAVRVLHNLSFVEDPTRMLRAVRFSEKFGFRISKHTLHLIRNYVKLDVFKDLSGPRLFDELRNMLGEEVSVKCIGRLHELGLLRLIHGSITWDVEREAFIERAREAAVWHRLLYAKDGAEGWVVIFLALTDALNDEELDGLLKRLGVEGKKLMEIFASRAAGLNALRRISGAARKKSEVYGLLRELPMEVVLYLLAKAQDEGAKKALASYVTKLRYVETALNGDDLKAMGIEEGPAVGEALRLLLDKRLDDEITAREEEEGFVRDYLKTGGRGAEGA